MRYSKGKQFFIKKDFLFGNKLFCFECQESLTDGEVCIKEFYIESSKKCFCKDCDKLKLNWRQ